MFSKTVRDVRKPMQGVAHLKDYRILISRSENRPHAQLYAFNLQDTIPKVELPLKATDHSPIVELKPILDGVYDRAGYHFRIDYRKPPVPALSKEAATWVNTLLAEQS